MLSLFKRLKKRQSVFDIQANNGWQPGYSESFPPTTANRLATVGRCISLYASILKTARLQSKPTGHYIIDLLKMPNHWQSREDFMESLCNEFYLNGEFRAKINFNSQGKVTSLLPFKRGQIYCYPVKGDYNDSLSIQSGGIYFRDNHSRVFTKDDIFQIIDSSGNWDNLNGWPRVVRFASSFSQAWSMLDFNRRLSDAGLRGPSMLSGINASDSDSLQGIRKVIEDFNRSSSPGKILSLPPEFKVSDMSIPNSHLLVQILSSFSDSIICKIFDVPVELAGGRSDAKVEISGQSLKTAVRLWLNTSVKSFLKKVSSALENLAMDKTKFSFDIENLYSDTREKTLMIKTLIDSGIISKEQASSLFLEGMPSD